MEKYILLTKSGKKEDQVHKSNTKRLKSNYINIYFTVNIPIKCQKSSAWFKETKTQLYTLSDRFSLNMKTYML